MNVEKCTRDTPCAACRAGRAMASAREDKRETAYGHGRSAPRRLFFSDALCRSSLMPRAYCAGCEQGHHDREAWR